MVVVVVSSSLEGPGFLFRVRRTATSVNLVKLGSPLSRNPASPPPLLLIPMNQDRSNSSYSPFSALSPLLSTFLHLIVELKFN